MEVSHFCSICDDGNSEECIKKGFVHEMGEQIPLCFKDNGLCPNTQLWVLAENGCIELLSIFQNQDGSQIMWTGNSFVGIEQKDSGSMHLNDKWGFKGVHTP